MGEGEGEKKVSTIEKFIFTILGVLVFKWISSLLRKN